MGFDYNRLHLLLAVLQKEGLKLFNQDIYINVSGAFPIRETGADLAVCLAVASALFKKPLPLHTLYLGEVSLTGELKGVARMDLREKEARRFGFQEIVKPGTTYPTLSKVLKATIMV